MTLPQAANRLIGKLGYKVQRLASQPHHNRNERRYLHARPKGTPQVSWHLPDFQVTPADVELTERVVRAFGLAKTAQESLQERGGKPREDLWTNIRAEYHNGFEELLVRGDVQRCAEVLSNALHRDVSRGLCHDDSEKVNYLKLRDPEAGRYLAGLLIDRFVALAEALGVLSVEFPEWGRWGENYYVDLEDLYERVRAACGADLAVPECLGLYGIRAGKNVIPLMTPGHAYAAWRIGEVLGGGDGASVAEIGGGYGGTAYYAQLRPLKRYLLFDLLIPNALQAFFLMKTCGPEHVRLFGEPEKDQRVQVLPYWEIHQVPDKSLDLVVSQEAMAEIDERILSSYLHTIARSSRYLLHIDQESGARVNNGFRQNVVPSLIDTDAMFKRLYRFPYWLRAGEVEELYETLSS